MRLLGALAALLFAGAATAASAAPAIWQVSDADSSVWLMGSVHVLPKAVGWRTPALDGLMALATQVYFEADIGPLGQFSILLKSLLGGFKATEPWVDKLTPERLAELTKAAQKVGVPMAQIEAFDPWFAQSLIEEKSMEQLGYLPALGLDSVLQGELPKEKKAYFETVAGQLALFAKQPLSDQITRLMASIEHADDLPASLKTMVDDWSSGDVDGLAVSVASDPSVDQGFAQTMILDRNQVWIPAIEKLLASNEPDLIVVGAGHLAGDGSVLDLLTKNGFTVKRIQ